MKGLSIEAAPQCLVRTRAEQTRELFQRLNDMLIRDLANSTFPCIVLVSIVVIFDVEIAPAIVQRPHLALLEPACYDMCG